MVETGCHNRQLMSCARELSCLGVSIKRRGMRIVPFAPFLMWPTTTEQVYAV